MLRGRARIPAPLRLGALGAVALLASIGASAPPAVAATTPDAALTAQANAVRLEFLDPTAFGSDNADTRRSLSLIVSRSAAYVFVHGDQGYVGWFDPFADGWLISRWTMTDAGWRLATLALALPEQIAGAAPPSDAIAWPSRGRPVGQSLQGNDHARITAFAKAARSGALARVVADSEGQATAAGVLAARQAFIAGGLSAVAGAPGYGAYRASVRQVFFTRTDKLVTDPVLRKRIDTLPTAIRMSLHPVMAFARKDGLTVAVQSPLAPALVFFADFSSRGRTDGVAEPSHLSAVSLMAGGRA